MNIGFFLLMFVLKHSLTLFKSRENQKVLSSQQGVLDKEILFPLSYSFYALKGSMVLFLKLLNKGLYMDSL